MSKLSILLAVAAGGFAPWLFGETVDFNSAQPGKLPPHWTGSQTGKGTAKWSVEKDSSSPGKPYVLKQSGEAAFPVCLKDDTRLKNGFVEVRFKPISGNEDQAGGVVWRARDKDNYYVCRANALENNVVLYRMLRGQRSVLEIVGRKGGYGVKKPVARGEWHTLRVDFKDHLFKVNFDGEHLFDVQDNTFNEAGKVGVWTKADSVTVFDDFSYGSGS